MVLLLAHLPLKCVAIIPAAVSWVRVNGVSGVLCEGLRVAFWTNTVSHARAMWVDGATGAMQHATCNDLKKSGVCIFIRQLYKHHAVVLIGPLWFVIGVQNEQNVCMGQASLLPLNDMNVSHHPAKNALLQKLVQQVL